MTGQEGLEDMDAKEQYAIRVQWLSWDRWIDSLVRSVDGRHIFVTDNKEELRQKLAACRGKHSRPTYTPVIIRCYKLTEPL